MSNEKRYDLTSDETIWLDHNWDLCLEHIPGRSFLVSLCLVGVGAENAAVSTPPVDATWCTHASLKRNEGPFEPAI